MTTKSKKPSLKFQPATTSLWPDLEALFGERGACGGCWCMFWRLPRKQWEAQRGPGNKAALRKIVNASRAAPGILAYVGNEPVGWSNQRWRICPIPFSGTACLRHSEQPASKRLCVVQRAGPSCVLKSVKIGGMVRFGILEAQGSSPPNDRCDRSDSLVNR